MPMSVLCSTSYGHGVVFLERIYRNKIAYIIVKRYLFNFTRTVKLFFKVISPLYMPTDNV